MVARRTLLKAIPALLLAKIASPALGQPMRPAGLQLSSLIGPLERDLENTLRAVARIFFRNVETLGALGMDPTVLRETLQRCGLTSTSQHLSPGPLYGVFQDVYAGRIGWDAAGSQWASAFDLATVEAVVLEGIARAGVLGQTNIVWQFGWQSEYDLAMADRYAAAFDRAGRLCADAGMHFSFHNQAKEFVPVDGGVPFDHILAMTRPELVSVQLNTYAAMRGGADPVALLRANDSRIRLAHLKDGTATGPTELGKGTVDLATFLSVAERSNIADCFVEDEVTPNLRSATAAYAYLHGL